MVAYSATILPLTQIAPIVYLGHKLRWQFQLEFWLTLVIACRIAASVCHGTELHDDRVMDPYDPTHPEALKTFFSLLLPASVFCSTPSFPKAIPVRFRAPIEIVHATLTVIVTATLLSAWHRALLLGLWCGLPIAIWFGLSYRFDTHNGPISLLRIAAATFIVAFSVAAALLEGFGSLIGFSEFLICLALMLVIWIQPFEDSYKLQAKEQAIVNPDASGTVINSSALLHQIVEMENGKEHSLTEADLEEVDLHTQRQHELANQQYSDTRYEAAH